MKKIGIVGTRTKDTNEYLKKVTDEFLVNYSEGDIIISGGCKQGGDRFAVILKNKYKVPYIEHLPDKSKLDKRLEKVNLRAAYAIINYERNTLIAEESDILIAVVADGDRKKVEQKILLKNLKSFIQMENW
jgi:hypothetical protein